MCMRACIRSLSLTRPLSTANLNSGSPLFRLLENVAGHRSSDIVMARDFSMNSSAMETLLVSSGVMVSSGQVASTIHLLCLQDLTTKMK